MVERRWHKKSRNGCDQCKQRRVKCDETLPICKGCIRRSTNCSYAEAPRPQQITTTTSSVSPADTTTSNEQATINTVSTPGSTGIGGGAHGGGSINHVPAYAAELEIMHHFSMKTYMTCDSMSLPSDFWQEHLPLMAMQHDYLLFALMSFTCLHMGYLRPAHADKYTSLALAYRDRTLKILPTLFDDVSRAQAEACFWSSAMIGLIGLATYTTPARRSQSARDLLLEVWALWKGTGVIGDVYAPVVGEGFAQSFNPISPCMPTSEESTQMKTEVDADNADLDVRVLQVRQCILLEAEKGSGSDEAGGGGLAPDARKAYLQAVDDFGRAWFLYRSTGSWGGIMAFFPHQDRLVMEDFRAGGQLATLIMMLFGVALHHLRHIWYIQDLGAKLVEELTAKITSSADDESKANLGSWAKKQVCS